MGLVQVCRTNTDNLRSTPSTPQVVFYLPMMHDTLFYRPGKKVFGGQVQNLSLSASLSLLFHNLLDISSLCDFSLYHTLLVCPPLCFALMNTTEATRETAIDACRPGHCQSLQAHSWQPDYRTLMGGKTEHHIQEPFCTRKLMFTWQDLGLY